MRLFFLFLVILEFNFSYSITPTDIEDSFNKIKIYKCRELISLSEKWQKPFYFRTTIGSHVMWFEVNRAGIHRGRRYLDPTVFALNVKQWDLTGNWSAPYYSPYCLVNLFDDNSIMRIFYLEFSGVPITKNQLPEEKKMEKKFFDIDFFVKEAPTVHSDISESELSARGHDLKDSHPRTESEDEDSNETTPLIKKK